MATKSAEVYSSAASKVGGSSGTSAGRIAVATDRTEYAFKGRLIYAGLDAEGNIVLVIRRNYDGEQIAKGIDRRLRGGEYVFKIVKEGAL